MSFSSVLKSIGKDLSHVGTWIDDGLKIAQPIVSVVDPPLGAIFTEVENILGGVSSTVTLNAATVQGIVTAVATLESVKSTLPAAVPASTP
jgi:hypothetical protein